MFGNNFEILRDFADDRRLLANKNGALTCMYFGLDPKTLKDNQRVNRVLPEVGARADDINLM